MHSIVWHYPVMWLFKETSDAFVSHLYTVAWIVWCEPHCNASLWNGFFNSTGAVNAKYMKGVSCKIRTQNNTQFRVLSILMYIFPNNKIIHQVHHQSMTKCSKFKKCNLIQYCNCFTKWEGFSVISQTVVQQIIRHVHIWNVLQSDWGSSCNYQYILKKVI